jgi:hypothetical protein
MTTLVIKEQRGVFYAEVEVLNGCNIVSGSSPYNAFINWKIINSGWYPTKIKLTINDGSPIIPITDFIETYQ